MSWSKKFFRFSEYKTYATYMLRHHPNEFHFHDLEHFGAGGLRFRDANSIVKDMLATCNVSDGGLAYRQVKLFVDESLRRSGENPAYIQLDHVYGLDATDLEVEADRPVATLPTFPCRVDSPSSIAAVAMESPPKFESLLSLYQLSSEVR
jgi:hypothetical protein